MSKRSRDPDPTDPAQWIGQPYTPRDPYYYVTGQGRFSFSPARSPLLYGFLLFGGCAFAWVALIAAGLIQASGWGFWALLVLIGAALIGTRAGAASARHRRQAREAHRHHHHHKV
jgi:hypothetical protein